MLDKFLSTETVEVTSIYYNTPYQHKVVWEDIYNVYHLAKQGSVESIKRLQNDYQLKDKNHSVFVRLRTPIFNGKPNKDDCHIFTLSEVKGFYTQVIEHLEWLKRKEEEHEMKAREEAIRNEPKKLAETINNIMNEN